MYLASCYAALHVERELEEAGEVRVPSRTVDLILHDTSTRTTATLETHTNSDMSAVARRVRERLHPAVRPLSIMTVGTGRTGPLLSRTGVVRDILEPGSSATRPFAYITSFYAIAGGGKRRLGSDTDEAGGSSTSAAAASCGPAALTDGPGDSGLAARPFDPCRESSVRIEEVGNEAGEPLAPATSSHRDEMAEWIRQDRLEYAARLAAFAKEHNMEHLPEMDIKEAMAEADQEAFHEAVLQSLLGDMPDGDDGVSVTEPFDCIAGKKQLEEHLAASAAARASSSTPAASVEAASVEAASDEREWGVTLTATCPCRFETGVVPQRANVLTPGVTQRNVCKWYQLRTCRFWTRSYVPVYTCVGGFRNSAG
jgi:hypothetical protein